MGHRWLRRGRGWNGPAVDGGCTGCTSIGDATPPSGEWHAQPGLNVHPATWAVAATMVGLVHALMRAPTRIVHAAARPAMATAAFAECEGDTGIPVYKWATLPLGK